MQRAGAWYNPLSWRTPAAAPVAAAPAPVAAAAAPAPAAVKPETTRLGVLQTVELGKNWIRANNKGILPGEAEDQKVWTGKSGSSEKRLQNRNPNTSFVNREFDEYNTSNPSWKTLKNEKGAYVKPTSLKTRLSKGRFYGKNPIAAQNTFTRFAQTYNPSQLTNYTRRYTNATKRERASWNSIKKGMNSDTSKGLSTMDAIFQKYVTGLTNTLKARHADAKKRYEAYRRREIQTRADLVKKSSGWSPEPVASADNMKQAAVDLLAELQDTAKTFNPENPAVPVKSIFSFPTLGFGFGAAPAAGLEGIHIGPLPPAPASGTPKPIPPPRSPASGAASFTVQNPMLSGMTQTRKPNGSAGTVGKASEYPLNARGKPMFPPPITDYYAPKGPNGKPLPPPTINQARFNSGIFPPAPSSIPPPPRINNNISAAFASSSSNGTDPFAAPPAAAPPAAAPPAAAPSMTSAINALKKLNTRNKHVSALNSSTGELKPKGGRRMSKRNRKGKSKATKRR